MALTVMGDVDKESSKMSQNQLATQRDVAKLARTSQAAVSRVMRGHGYVAKDVRLRIQNAAVALKYRPDPFARILNGGQSDIVAVAISNVVNPLFPFVLDALTEKLQRSGKNILLFNAAHDQNIEELIPEILTYRVSAIVIMTAALTTRASEICDQSNVPVIFFHRHPATEHAFAVTCDGQHGGAQAASELIGSGCRHLAYLGGNTDSSPNLERRRGFLDAATKAGMPAIAKLEMNFSYEWGWQGIGRLLNDEPTIDGLFCGDDAIASGAIDRLRYDLGRRVPEDVSVIGFDDVPQASWSAYALTTIRQPIDRMIELSLSIINSPSEHEQRHYRLRGELIRRNTVR